MNKLKFTTEIKSDIHVNGYMQFKYVKQDLQTGPTYMDLLLITA